MTANTPLQLIPEEESKSKRLFNTNKDYQDFRISLQKAVQHDLDRQREARRQSEEQSKQLLVT